MNSRKAKVAFEQPPPDVDDEEEYDDEGEGEGEYDEEGEGEYDEEGEEGFEYASDGDDEGAYAMEESLADYLTTEDGDNVATALMTISDNVASLTKVMETQNKILVKIASKLVSQS
jgi:hypothetical protein